MAEAVLGAILAGGLARRMGGGDKSLRRVGGRTVLARVIERFRPQCAALLLSANGDPARFSGYDLPVVADGLPDSAGPLAGVLAALDHAAACHPGIAIVATVAADTPFLPLDLVGRLAEAREAEGAEIACAASGGRTHPVSALWPVSLRGALRRALVVDGERGVGRFAARHHLAVAAWDAEPVDPFFNVNEPDDLARAEALSGALRD